MAELHLSATATNATITDATITDVTTAAPPLAARNLTIGYRQGRRPVVLLDELTLSLHRGELVCLLGPNGAGKSTLMRTLAGLQPPLAGELWLGDIPLAHLSPRARAQRIGLVLTERITVGRMTAFEVVALGRHPYTDWQGNLTASDEDAVVAALAATGALPLARRPVNELSDGERQKVMIARALAQEPEVLLLDEPTAFLDLPRRVELMGMLRDLARQHGRAILLSTHDLDLALRCADHIWLLPPGGPLRTGTPEDLVLTGALAQVFAGAGVQFDPTTGAFHMTSTTRLQVALQGEGVAYIWTARALERAGYALAAHSPIQIQVVQTSATPAWHITQTGTTYPCASIGELLVRLERLDA